MRRACAAPRRVVAYIHRALYCTSPALSLTTLAQQLPSPGCTARAQEWSRPKPSERPDVFPDLERLETPLPQKLPGDPELPEDEEWDEQQRKKSDLDPDKKPPEVPPGEEEGDEKEKDKKKKKKKEDEDEEEEGEDLEEGEEEGPLPEE